MVWGRLLLVLMFCGLAAQADAQALTVKELRKLQVAPPSHPAPWSGAKSRPVHFSKIVIHPRDGQAWAVVYSLYVFGSEVRPPPPQLVSWDGGRIEADSTAFGPAFEEELTKAGFSTDGAESSLFEKSGPSDLQVAVLVNDVKGRFCANCPVPLDRDKTTAVVDMGARWEVYSTSKGAVVARINTHGGGTTTQPVNDSILPAMLEAYRENVRQLLASDEFRKVVSDTEPTTSLPASAKAPVAFAPAGGALSLAQAANGVVTIFAGEAMGSGVLISSEGYILTNHHVAGDSGRVRVRWADGSEAVAEVLRGDRARDVALLKVAGVKVPPLAIRHGQAQLGEPVYAIGTPLDEKLQNTVTRGIVSGFRLIDGRTFIQSDVPITHGNSGGPLLDDKGAVIGLTDLGMDPAAGSSLNFFIPIDDALKVLALQPAG